MPTLTTPARTAGAFSGLPPMACGSTPPPTSVVEAIVRAVRRVASEQRPYLRQLALDLLDDVEKIAARLTRKYPTSRDRLRRVKRAVRNAFLDKLRAEKRRRVVRLSPRLGDGEEVTVDPLDRLAAPHNVLEAVERREALRCELARLDGERASVVAVARATCKRALRRSYLSHLRSIRRHRLALRAYFMAADEAA